MKTIYQYVVLIDAYIDGTGNYKIVEAESFREALKVYLACINVTNFQVVIKGLSAFAEDDYEDMLTYCNCFTSTEETIENVVRIDECMRKI